MDKLVGKQDFWEDEKVEYLETLTYPMALIKR